MSVIEKAQPMSAGEPAKALWISTVAFTLCFAVWTIFAIIGIRIKQDLGLNEAEFGLLVGTPVLTGSLVRIVLGIWTGRYGGRLVYTLTMLAAALATFLLSYAQTYTQMLIAGLGVGLAGNRARHLRCRQCRRGCDQIRRPLRAARMGLAGGCRDLGRLSGTDGNRLLVHHDR
jgi:MFS family permease